MQGLEHNPTNEKRSLVKTLAAVGITFEDIATKLGISEKTLTKHYRKELDEGRIDANAEIGRGIYQVAKDGNVSAMMFWLRTRAGWKETNGLELSGQGGQPIQVITGIKPRKKIDNGD